MDKFKSALDSGKFKDAVAADVKYANGLGTGGMGGAEEEGQVVAR